MRKIYFSALLCILCLSSADAWGQGGVKAYWNDSRGYDYTAQSFKRNRILPRHEIGVGVGVGGYEIMDNGYWYDWESGQWGPPDSAWREFERSLYYEGREIYTPAISLHYYYSPINWIQVGGVFSYTSLSREMYETVSRRKVGSDYDRYFSIGPSVRISYFARDYIRIYSALEVVYVHHARGRFQGYAYRENHIALGFTALGITVGNRIYAGGELGISSSGVLKFIAGYRF